MALYRPPVGTILKANIACWYNGQLGLNVRYFDVTTVGTGGATLEEIADGLEGIFQPVYSPCLTNDALFLGVGVKPMGIVPDVAGVPSPALPSPGTGGTAPMPTQICGLIKLTTVLAGRKNRGRMYIPFPDTVFNDVGDKPTTAYLVALEALAGTLLSGPIPITGSPGTSSLTPVIYSPITAIAVDITGRDVRQAWATQRRRGTLGAQNPAIIPIG